MQASSRRVSVQLNVLQRHPLQKAKRSCCQTAASAGAVQALTTDGSVFMLRNFWQNTATQLLEAKKRYEDYNSITQPINEATLTSFATSVPRLRTDGSRTANRRQLHTG
jgi:predicted Abi (CAAX) family protease